MVADASPVGLGAVVLEDHEVTIRPVSFASRSLSEDELRY